MIDSPHLNDEEFQRFRKLIYDLSGINLGDAKKQLLVTRLHKRIRELGLSSFSEYREQVLNDPSGSELTTMLNAISTNKTDFFRENAHFEFLKREVYPKLVDQRTIRVWSAACSSGEEPYTIAMTLSEMLPNFQSRDIKILATDLSTRVLDHAEEGLYSEQVVEPIPGPLVSKYFQAEDHRRGRFYRIAPAIKNVIRFRRLNLMGEFPLNTEFDFIFCRNVMIYFDKPTQGAVVNKLEKFLKPGGHLFIGHSESLIGVQTQLSYVQSSIYRK
jgi:chemotaxis protein methyltransferase CheR